jgi:hypothetical protein
MPDARRDGQRVVRRGTDASGFYVPRTVLTDEAPAERYHDEDPNVADPFIEHDCGGAPAALIDARPSCEAGVTPRSRLKLATAMRAHDLHAEQACASRAWLRARLSPEALRQYPDDSCRDRP